MAVVVGEAAVRLRPETSGFAAEAEGDIDGSMPGVAKKAAGFFAAAFAAVKIGGFLKDAIGEASDLGESASKVGVVFGQAAGQVNDFARNAAAGLGQSQAQALAATGTFGNLLRSLGLSEQASADMSTGFVTLASDLASFNNVDPTVALDALRAGLTGETEPLKQFGVNINAAGLEAKALELGLIKQGEVLTDAAKSQAAYALIMEQTTLAQGDFARTSEGLANQTRIIGSQFVDLKANVGGLLTPLAAIGAQAISGTVMPALLNLTAQLPAVGTALGSFGDIAAEAFRGGDPQALVEALGPAGGVAYAIGQAAVTAGDFGATFSEAMADGQVGAGLLAQGGLPAIAGKLGVLASDARQAGGEILGALGGAFTDLQAAVAPALSGVGAALSSAAGPIKEAFSGLFGGGEGGGPFDGIVAGIGPVLDTIVPLIAGFVTRYADLFAAIIPIIVQVVTALVPIVTQVFGLIGPIIAQLIPIITQVATILSGALLAAISAIAPVIPTLVQAFGSIATILAGAFVAALQAILPILPILASVLATVAGLLAGALATAFQALLPVIPPIVAALAQIAVILVGVFMQALTAILPLIPTLVQVLLTLVTSVLVPLLPLLPVLAGLLVTVVTALAPLIPVALQVVTLLIQLVIAAITPIIGFLPVLVGAFVGLVTILASVVSVVVTVVGAFISFAATVIGVVVGFVSSVVGFFAGLVSGIVGLITGFVSAVVGFWVGLITTVVGLVTGFVTAVVQFFLNLVTGIKEKVQGVVDAVRDAFQKAKDKAVEIVDGIVSFVTSGFQRAVDAIKGVLSGIAGIVSGAFSGVQGIIKGVINGVITLVNGAIGGLNSLIGLANMIPGVSIPTIGSIPYLHEGGMFDSGLPGGEGLAVLRDRELVATPEQQVVANNLLRDLLAGRVGAPGASPGFAGAGTAVQIDVHPAPGMDEREIAAHVSSDLGWQLSVGATGRPALLGAAS